MGLRLAPLLRLLLAFDLDPIAERIFDIHHLDQHKHNRGQRHGEQNTQKAEHDTEKDLRADDQHRRQIDRALLYQRREHEAFKILDQDIRLGGRV